MLYQKKVKKLHQAQLFPTNASVLILNFFHTRIEAYNKAELEKAHQEKALNLLESAVISYKQKLQDDEFVSFANTDEVDKIKARSNEVSSQKQSRLVLFFFEN